MKKHKALILGRSSSGKTSSLRNLDPAKTGIINCDKEELVFPSETPQTETKSKEINTAKSKADELREFKKLLDEGIISQEEFDKEKKKILEKNE